jgi:large subunit ribosomal protein L33
VATPRRKAGDANVGGSEVRPGRPAGVPLRKSSPVRKAVMAKGKKRLEVIHLVCQETGDQNYTLRRKSGGEKLKVKKYSPRLRKHTVHVEKKK